MAISTYLNVNKLNALIKTGWLIAFKKKEEHFNMLPTRDHFRAKDKHRLKMKKWKKIFHSNGNGTKAGVAILISDKIDFKTKTIAKDKEGII